MELKWAFLLFGLDAHELDAARTTGAGSPSFGLSKAAAGDLAGSQKADVDAGQTREDAWIPRTQDSSVRGVRSPARMAQKRDAKVSCASHHRSRPRPSLEF